jgi:flagellum-specific ATP synthase
LRKLLAAHREAKDLIEIGAYVPGTNPVVDRAVALQDAIGLFLRQGTDEKARTAESWAALQMIAGAA